MPMSTPEAQREYQRNRIARIRLEWIESRGGRCEICGSKEKLEVDHIDPSQKIYNPREIWSRRKEVKDAELAKCQVLCSSCHKHKTKIEQGWKEHGSPRAYRRGCRCSECRAAHAEYRRIERARSRDRSKTM